MDCRSTTSRRRSERASRILRKHPIDSGALDTNDSGERLLAAPLQAAHANNLHDALRRQADIIATRTLRDILFILAAACLMIYIGPDVLRHYIAK